jgi:hypothetical protein
LEKSDKAGADAIEAQKRALEQQKKSCPKK